MAVTTIGFRLATNPWQMSALRSLAGVFGGTVVTIRTMLSENSTQNTQARAFSLFAFSGNLGIFCGPFISATFADPAAQYPSLFGSIQLLHNYPYLLPGLVTGEITELIALSTIFWLDEVPTNTNTKQEPPSRKPIVISPVVLVFYFTPISMSGFGFPAARISMSITLAGFSPAVWLLVIFLPLQRLVAGAQLALNDISPSPRCRSRVATLVLEISYFIPGLSTFWTTATPLLENLTMTDANGHTCDIELLASAWSCSSTLRAARAPEPNSPPGSSSPRLQKLVASNVTNEVNRSRPSNALAPPRVHGKRGFIARHDAPRFLPPGG
ncbi:hypothetical protein AURDEDRAFT_165810 [Auricularia subglabra TFB-10046 SS5]|nr:hypothetical protein AURDEDRAFT_165810 [Auricularia subglabra TFB-10046 SS5]